MYFRAGSGAGGGLGLTWLLERDGAARTRPVRARAEGRRPLLPRTSAPPLRSSYTPLEKTPQPQSTHHKTYSTNNNRLSWHQDGQNASGKRIFQSVHFATDNFLMCCRAGFNTLQNAHVHSDFLRLMTEVLLTSCREVHGPALPPGLDGPGCAEGPTKPRNPRHFDGIRGGRKFVSDVFMDRDSVP